MQYECEDLCDFEHCDRVEEDAVTCIIIDHCTEKSFNILYLVIGIALGCIITIAAVTVGACLGKALTKLLNLNV